MTFANNLIVTVSLALFGSTAFGVTAAARKDEPIQPIPAPAKLDAKAAKKVELGKRLFFDPRLSKSGFLSCNSCHNLATGGADNLPSSVGHKWQLGPINSPTVLNAKFNLAQFWDGRAKNLIEQAGGPIANPGEMASTHAIANDVLNSIPQYREWFKEVYGQDRATTERVTDAIAAFEETLVTPDSRFDKWLAGSDKALTAEELHGYNLFKEKGCAGCHNGPAVGGGSFQKFGLVKPYERDTKTVGRFAVTKNELDKFVFKVPTLRNVELTAPYFHDGSVWTLDEAVKVMGEHQLGVSFQEPEVKAVVAFLKTLTGKQPEIAVPALPPSTATTPKPSFD